MSVQVCVLGSGSGGNATLLMTPSHHVLIDAGFPPDDLSERMEGTGASWSTLDAVILTHMHGDHLKKKCLAICAEYDIQFICHAAHAAQLVGGRYYKRLAQKGLVRTFEAERDFEIAPELRFRALALSHDAPPTFGFHIQALGTSGWTKLAYLADLGECSQDTAKAIADVDLLALEFNHDEKMELHSGRHPRLIERVLSSEGHLSNAQAAEFLRQVVEHGPNGGPRLLLQMHLSRECNRAELAYQAAQQVLLLSGAQTRVYSTRQDRRGTVHTL